MPTQFAPEATDLRSAIDKLWRKRALFARILLVVFVLSCGYVLCVPRSYDTSLQIVPEMGGSSTGGGIADLISMSGFGGAIGSSDDAISPLLYPNLMEDNGFVASLYSIRVKSKLPDDDIDTTYYDYMTSFQKHPFWTNCIKAIGKIFARKEQNDAVGEYDPYHISRKEAALMKEIRNKINISVDKSTAVITINVNAQDPLIARTLADSVKEKLQAYIIGYRTGKARVDMEYYGRLRDEAWRCYDSVSTEYAHLTDADADVLLRTIRLKQEKLERDMQLRYEAYTVMEKQYQTAVAKVQERTPAFVLLKGADVPVRPSRPKRMLTVIGALFLSTIVTSVYVLRKELIDIILA